ncbi:MAG: hypothetical protein AAGE52_10625, partial [Myxococcota bacterium]
MSFDLHVTPVDWPDDALTKWTTAACTVVEHLEFDPAFDPKSSSGFQYVALAVGNLWGAHDAPTGRFLAEFDYAALRDSFVFGCARNPLVGYVVAASLAEVTRGSLVDPQSEHGRYQGSAREILT